MSTILFVRLHIYSIASTKRKRNQHVWFVTKLQLQEEKRGPYETVMLWKRTPYLCGAFQSEWAFGPKNCAGSRLAVDSELDIGAGARALPIYSQSNHFPRL
jgi:hypothetical protein